MKTKEKLILDKLKLIYNDVKRVIDTDNFYITSEKIIYVGDRGKLHEYIVEFDSYKKADVFIHVDKLGNNINSLVLYTTKGVIVLQYRKHKNKIIAYKFKSQDNPLINQLIKDGYDGDEVGIGLLFCNYFKNSHDEEMAEGILDTRNGFKFYTSEELFKDKIDTLRNTKFKDCEILNINIDLIDIVNDGDIYGLNPDDYWVDMYALKVQIKSKNGKIKRYIIGTYSNGELASMIFKNQEELELLMGYILG